MYILAGPGLFCFHHTQVPVITLCEDDSCLTSLNSACQRICTAGAVSGEFDLTHHIIHVEKFALHENVRWGRVGRWGGVLLAHIFVLS